MADPENFQIFGKIPYHVLLNCYGFFQLRYMISHRIKILGKGISDNIRLRLIKNFCTVTILLTTILVLKDILQEYQMLLLKNSREFDGTISVLFHLFRN